MTFVMQSIALGGRQGSETHSRNPSNTSGVLSGYSTKSVISGKSGITWRKIMETSGEALRLAHPTKEGNLEEYRDNGRHLRRSFVELTMWMTEGKNTPQKETRLLYKLQRILFQCRKLALSIPSDKPNFSPTIRNLHSLAEKVEETIIDRRLGSFTSRDRELVDEMMEELKDGVGAEGEGYHLFTEEGGEEIRGLLLKWMLRLLPLMEVCREMLRKCKAEGEDPNFHNIGYLLNDILLVKSVAERLKLPYVSGVATDDVLMFYYLRTEQLVQLVNEEASKLLSQGQAPQIDLNTIHAKAESLVCEALRDIQNHGRTVLDEQRQPYQFYLSHCEVLRSLGRQGSIRLRPPSFPNGPDRLRSASETQRYFLVIETPPRNLRHWMKKRDSINQKIGALMRKTLRLHKKPKIPERIKKLQGEVERVGRNLRQLENGIALIGAKESMNAQVDGNNTKAIEICALQKGLQVPLDTLKTFFDILRFFAKEERIHCLCLAHACRDLAWQGMEQNSIEEFVQACLLLKSLKEKIHEHSLSDLITLGEYEDTREMITAAAAPFLEQGDRFARRVDHLLKEERISFAERLVTAMSVRSSLSWLIRCCQLGTSQRLVEHRNYIDERIQSALGFWVQMSREDQDRLHAEATRTRFSRKGKKWLVSALPLRMLQVLDERLANGSIEHLLVAIGEINLLLERLGEKWVTRCFVTTDMQRLLNAYRRRAKSILVQSQKLLEEGKEQSLPSTLPPSDEKTDSETPSTSHKPPSLGPWKRLSLQGTAGTRTLSRTDRALLIQQLERRRSFATHRRARSSLSTHFEATPAQESGETDSPRNPSKPSHSPRAKSLGAFAFLSPPDPLIRLRKSLSGKRSSRSTSLSSKKSRFLSLVNVRSTEDIDGLVGEPATMVGTRVEELSKRL